MCQRHGRAMTMCDRDGRLNAQVGGSKGRRPAGSRRDPGESRSLRARAGRRNTFQPATARLLWRHRAAQQPFAAAFGDRAHAPPEFPFSGVEHTVRQQLGRRGKPSRRQQSGRARPGHNKAIGLFHRRDRHGVDGTSCGGSQTVRPRASICYWTAPTATVAEPARTSAGCATVFSIDNIPAPTRG